MNPIKSLRRILYAIALIPVAAILLSSLIAGWIVLMLLSGIVWILGGDRSIVSTEPHVEGLESIWESFHSLAK